MKKNERLVSETPVKMKKESLQSATPAAAAEGMKSSSKSAKKVDNDQVRIVNARIL
jgi:hypothetical protein